MIIKKLILGEETTQELDDATLTEETKYPTNFTQSGKRFVLRLQYNCSNSFLFVNATKIYQFKAKDSLGNISRFYNLWYEKKKQKKNRIKRKCKTFFCWF